MKTLNQILKQAKRKKTAIGHFNASTFEQMKAIAQAANLTKTPVMIGTSQGELEYLGLERTVVLFRRFRKECKVPIFLNLDHAKSFAICKAAIDGGYDSVLFDGSRLPYAQNLKITKQVRDYAKKIDRNISVEGELGTLPTESSKVYRTKIKVDPAQFTDPAQAREFFGSTRVDRLAPSFGTLHGIQAGGINPHIDINRLKEISSAVPSAFLVMHGGSGTPSRDIRNAIRAGICNVHISTEIRRLYVESLRRQLRRDEYAPYKILEPVVAAMTKFIAAKIKSFK